MSKSFLKQFSGGSGVLPLSWPISPRLFTESVPTWQNMNFVPKNCQGYIPSLCFTTTSSPPITGYSSPAVSATWATTAACTPSWNWALLLCVLIFSVTRLSSSPCCLVQMCLPPPSWSLHLVYRRVCLQHVSTTDSLQPSSCILPNDPTHDCSRSSRIPRNTWHCHPCTLPHSNRIVYGHILYGFWTVSYGTVRYGIWPHPWGGYGTAVT